MVAAMTRTFDRRRCSLGADLLQLAGLEEAQQQPLHAQGHLADFVEEHRPLVRHLELARLVPIGAGEAALHVPKQLRFEKRLGQARAVHRDERTRRSSAAHMKTMRDHLFAGAALAGDQHLCIGARNARNFLFDIEKRRAPSDQGSK